MIKTLNKTLQSILPINGKMLSAFLKVKFFGVYLVLFFGFSTVQVHAQFNNNWAFGIEQGLNFDGDSIKLIKTKINESRLLQQHGYNTSMSDCSGNLLFYSNGQAVWNKNNDTMENGILFNSTWGITSGYTNILSIPLPHSSTKYILVYSTFVHYRDIPGYYKTVGNALRYAVIDMSYNSGLGKILFKDSVINNTYFPSTNLAWAKHANDTNIWIIAPSSNDTLCSYLLTKDGLNETPVKSIAKTNTLPHSKASNIFYVGYIKMANANNKLLVSNLDPKQTALGTILEYDFNKETGKITNPKKILGHNELDAGWELSNAQYSPNDSLIYTISLNAFNYYNFSALELFKIHQIDRKSLKRKQVFSLNRYNIKSYNNPFGWAMQKTPTGELIVTLGTHLYTIKKPNKWGTNSNIQFIDTLLPVKKTDQGDVLYGTLDIPNIYNTDRILYFNKDNSNGTCQDTAAFTYLGDSTFYKLIWRWGDGDSTIVLPPNIKQNSKINHKYKVDGQYKVTLQSFHSTCDQKQRYTDEFNITIPPKVSLDTFYSKKACNNDTAVLNLAVIDSDSIQVDWGDGTQGVYFADSPITELQHAYAIEDTFTQIVSSLKGNGCDVEKQFTFIAKFNPKPNQQISVTGFEDSTTLLAKPLLSSCGPWSMNLQDNNETNVWVYNGTDSFHQDSLFAVQDTQASLFQIVSTNQYSCTSTDSFYAVAHEAPSINYSITAKDSCVIGNQIALNVQLNYDGNPTDLQSNIDWGDGLNEELTTGLMNHSYATSGDYRIVLEAQTVNCIFKDSFRFEVFENPIAEVNIIGDSFTCQGADSFRVALGNAHTYHINWENEFMDTIKATDIQRSSSWQFNSFGNKTLVSIAVSNKGCRDTVNQKLIVHAKPQLRITSVDTICLANFDEQIKAEVLNYNSINVDSSFYWYTGQVIPRKFTSGADSTIIAPGSQGNQFIELWSRTQEGCTDTLRKPVYIRPYIRLIEDLQEDLCIGDIYPFTLSSPNGLPFDTKWYVEDELIDSGAGLNVNFTYEPKLAKYSTIIDFKGIDGYGCYFHDGYLKNVYSKPSASFDERTTTSTPETATLLFLNTSKGATEYEWDIESYGFTKNKSPEIRFTDTGEFDILLLAINEGGCIDSTRKTILVYPEIDFYIPTAISANGDGLNDVLKMPSPRFINTIDFKIFNRWGEMVFNNNNPNTEWKPRAQGNYVYVAAIIDLNGEKHNLKGTILVLK